MDNYDARYNSLGLVFFLFLLDTTSYKGIISIIIIFNGILCHGSRFLEMKYAKQITYYDIICNIIIGLFTLYTEKIHKLFIFIIYLICIFNFIINKFRYNNTGLLHVLGIQLPSSIALSYYQF